jgi:hypothetical protein
MGPHGEATCRADPSHPARPSEPFCAKGEPPSSDTLAEALSRGRYCARYQDGLSEIQTEPKGAHYCAEYSPGRPFNGERIAEMASPDCLEWADGQPSIPICATGGASGRRGLPSCLAANIRKLRESYPFACTRWSPRLKCSRPVGGEEPDEGPTSVQDWPPLVDDPVWGVYCRRTQE